MKLFPAPRAITAALALLATFPAWAADRHVPMPYTTIQSAIDASTNGDSVIVQPGVYFENINFKGKNITVKSGNSNFDCIIDGQDEGPVVTFSGAEGPNASLRNMTLRNGTAANGGGIRGNFTQAYIKNCVIGANVATSDGGGIHGVSGIIENCTVLLNQAVNGGGIADCEGVLDSCRIQNNLATGKGGGIYDSAAEVRFCEITTNEALTHGGGASDCDGVFTGNLISGNKVTKSGNQANPGSFGGGLYNCAGTLTHNTISDNESNGNGGGLASCDGVIQNNLIVSNSARRGGGVQDLLGRVENNTIYGNSASNAGGGAADCGTSVANCIVAGNTAPADPQWVGANVPQFSCVQNWTGGQPDIVTGDPLLEDPSKGRYKLMEASPCIDAGRFIAGLAMDIEGKARPIDGTAVLRGDGSDYDIGAHEFDPPQIDLAGAWGPVQVQYKGKPGKIKGTIKATLIASNAGNQPLNAKMTVHYFLSTNVFLDPGDVVVGKVGKLNKMKVGTTKALKGNIKLAPNTSVTGLYLIGVLDSANAVIEPNEFNNVVVFGPLP